jgi:hypothetical protein
VHLEEADLTGADLSDVRLTAANLSLALLSEAILRETDLTEATLWKASFTKADLAGAHLVGVKARQARFIGTRLTGANLSGADLSHADLTTATLSGTDLKGANLSYANLSGVRFRRSDLTGADLTEANVLGTAFEDTRLDGAYIEKREWIAPPGPFHFYFPAGTEKESQAVQEMLQSVQWLQAEVMHLYGAHYETRRLPFRPPSAVEVLDDDEALFPDDTPPAQLIAAKEELSRKFFGDVSAESAIPSRNRTPLTPEPRFNVVGVGIGAKLVKGRPTADLSVTLLVRRKFPKAELTEPFRLPQKVNGFPTDVVETGAFSLHAHNPPSVNPRGSCRPVQPGCSIGPGHQSKGPQLAMAGTLGLIVKRKKAAALCLLSAAHVLTEMGQYQKKGIEVYQPSWFDTTHPAPDRVADLQEWRLWREHKKVTVDAAIALFHANVGVSGSVLHIGQLSGYGAPRVRMKVEKFGRATTHKTGRIAFTDTDVPIDIGDGSSRIYRNQIIIHGDNLDLFSAAGDSGAAVVASSSRKVVALLLGGVDAGRTGSYSFATPISVILDFLGVDLVP